MGGDSGQRGLDQFFSGGEQAIIGMGQKLPVDSLRGNGGTAVSGGWIYFLAVGNRQLLAWSKNCPLTLSLFL